MGDKVQAAAQYNDYTGDVAADGHLGPSIHDICKDKQLLPAGYFALGMSLWMGENVPDPKSPSIFRCTVFAADTAIVGKDMDAIQQYARAKGKVLVKPFMCELSPAEMRKYFKRLSIVFKDRGIEEAELEEIEEQE